jgi:fibronectin type 3 domain-containing protein
VPEAMIGTAGKPEYVDSAATFGKSYSYRVQAILDKALSEISQAVSVTPEDVFAPEIPSGVTAAAGINGIELTWKPAAAPDLKGYRVYRAQGKGDFSVLVDQIETPSFRDRQITSGETYRYQITSVDQADNESEHSSTIEVTAP